MEIYSTLSSIFTVLSFMIGIWRLLSVPGTLAQGPFCL